MRNVYHHRLRLIAHRAIYTRLQSSSAGPNHTPTPSWNQSPSTKPPSSSRDSARSPSVVEEAMERFVADLGGSGSSTESSPRPLTTVIRTDQPRGNDKAFRKSHPAPLVPKGKPATKDSPVQLYSAFYARALDEKIPDSSVGGDQFARRGRIKPRSKFPFRATLRQRSLSAQDGGAERETPLPENPHQAALRIRREEGETRTRPVSRAPVGTFRAAKRVRLTRKNESVRKEGEFSSNSSNWFTIEPRQGYGLLVWSSGDTLPDMISYARLREMCDCRKCRHPTTKQRLLTPKEILDDMTREGWMDGVPGPERLRDDGAGILIKWDKDGEHSVRLSKRIILSNIRPTTNRVFILQKQYGRTMWRGGRDLLAAARPIEYSKLFGEDGTLVNDRQLLTDVLRDLQSYGYVRLKSVPTDATDNAHCTLRSVAESIGPIRQTFYGELWDVKNKPNSTNVAYTDLNLGLHMDLLYYVDPPRFQLLHCLRNRVEGGESYFVDSFAVAEDFSSDHPAAAELLRTHELSFQYHNDGHHLSANRTILPRVSFPQSLEAAVSWSPPFQGVRPPFAWLPFAQRGSSSAFIQARFQAEAAQEREFLEAVALWESYLDKPRYRYEFKMKEGDLVLFDNRRVLHARKAFRDYTPEEREARGVPPPGEGEPSRWLKGCYLDGDAVWDKLYTLHTKHWKTEKAE